MSAVRVRPASCSPSAHRFMKDSHSSQSRATTRGAPATCSRDAASQPVLAKHLAPVTIAVLGKYGASTWHQVLAVPSPARAGAHHLVVYVVAAPAVSNRQGYRLGNQPDKWHESHQRCH